MQEQPQISIQHGRKKSTSKNAIIQDADINSSDSNIVLKTTKGGIYEALVAEMLTKSGYKDLRFFRNESGTVEIEFLTE